MCARRAARAGPTLALLAGLSLLPVPGAAPAPPRPRYVEGEILVKFRPEARAVSRRALHLDVAGVTRRGFASGAELWRLEGGLAVPEALRRLAGAPDIEYAEPNYLLHATRTPDDPLLPQQYSLENTGQEDGTAGADIDAARAWDLSTGGASVIVAVIDSGIDLDHPDLQPNLWTNPDEIPGNLVDDDGNGLVDDVHGWDFVNEDDDPRDDVGHGTHVAGIVAAAGNNGLGITGVAWRARLMPLKFLDAGGFGTVADAVQAIDYAVSKGARILNASWGGGDDSSALLEAIRDAGAHEALFVAAAGNDGADSDRAPFFPAGYAAPNIIAVAASDRQDRLAPFSNFGGTTVDLAAPGVQILSTLPGGRYGLMSGTSMATPHVSGVAALVLGLAPGMPAASLRQRLLEHAEPIAWLAEKVATAARLNAFQCLLDADTVPPGQVLGLRVTEPLSDGFVLSWTATGDDLDHGEGTAYDMRISRVPFEAAGFESASRVPLTSPPLPAGAAELHEIHGLEPSRTYFIALRAVDEWGNTGPPVFTTATTRPPPVAAIHPDAASVALGSGQTADRVITLHNPSDGTLDWSAAQPVMRPMPPRGAVGMARWGGPDPFGYVFIDSDEPDGPVFDWRDIGATGHDASLPGDGWISDPIPMGFTFPFYGQDFTRVRIGGNGFLTFSPAQASGENQRLPSQSAPGNLIAGFWDELDFPSSASVLWLAGNSAFVVQYNDVMRRNGGGPYTFQIILLASGEILFQYLELTGLAYSETIGIQDDSGRAGLSVAFNVPYVHERLALRLQVQKPWMTAAPRSGRLRAGASVPIALSFDASGLMPGTYDGLQPILTNDPDRPRVEIPLTLSVADAPAIAADPAAVDFGSVFAIDGSRFVVAFLNTGSLPLTVNAVVPGDPSVIAHFEPFSLGRGGRRAVLLDWLPGGPGLLRTTLRVESDAANAASLSIPLTGVALNIPPRAAALWPPTHIECSGPGGADVVLDASPSRDDDAGPSGIVRYEWIENPGTGLEALLGTGGRITRTLGIGTHPLALRVTDDRGATDRVDSTVVVADTTPPTLSLAVSRSVLWPPHHRLVPVRLSWSARDACSGQVTVALTGITSSEPDDAPGSEDGETTGDIVAPAAGTPNPVLLLRAERNDTGPGRTYTVRFVATDAAGLETPGEAVVTVPSRPGRQHR
jgi:subtilisin family serine protease